MSTMTSEDKLFRYLKRKPFLEAHEYWVLNSSLEFEEATGWSLDDFIKEYYSFTTDGKGNIEWKWITRLPDRKTR